MVNRHAVHVLLLVSISHPRRSRCRGEREISRRLGETGGFNKRTGSWTRQDGEKGVNTGTEIRWGKGLMQAQRRDGGKGVNIGTETGWGKGLTQAQRRDGGKGVNTTHRGRISDP